MKPTRLEAWTTALQADIYKDGLVDSKRLDIIIGPDARNGKGVSFQGFTPTNSSLSPCLNTLHVQGTTGYGALARAQISTPDVRICGMWDKVLHC